jgi:hypothetical protein
MYYAKHKSVLPKLRQLITQTLIRFMRARIAIVKDDSSKAMELINDQLACHKKALFLVHYREAFENFIHSSGTTPQS